tara:strand:- start:1705 stop:2400 length:696 start_codon:yes stop_codon:yes gene_type:complete
MRKYIKESAIRASKQRKEYVVFNRIPLLIKDPFIKDIDVKYVIKKIENTIPEHLMHLVDSIYVGSFAAFEKKNTNAAYQNGSIFVSNNQTDEADMIDDLTHEIAHAVEELAPDEIYGDNSIENEFLGKRRRLYNILKSEGYNVGQKEFLRLNYSNSFDELLYKHIGYPTLTTLTSGLFISPYAATSLREYFANAFETYFLEDRNYLKQISPKAFHKIEVLANYLKGEDEWI